MNNTNSTPSGNQKWGLMDYVRSIGPAIIVAAVILGPGSVTTASSLGASYGYEPLWIVVMAVLAAYLYQEPAIRIALHKEVGVIEAVRNEYSETFAKILFVMVYIGTLIFQAGNFIGAAMALNFFTPSISIVAWTIIMIGLAFIMAIASKYELIEGFTKVLVFLMVVSFVFTAIGSGPDVGQMVSQGFSFKIPGGDWLLILALLGTTMVPDIPLQLSALTKTKFSNEESPESKYDIKDKVKLANLDLIVSSVIIAVICIAIVICSATVLHPQGITVSGAAEMAMQLTPVLGRYAGILFSLGLWGAAFSSGLFRMQLMPMFFCQAMGYEEDLRSNSSKVVIALTAIVPTIIVIFFGAAPVELVVMAQALNGLLLPIVCAVMWKLSSDKNFLGEHANGTVRNILFGILMVVTVLLAARVFLTIIGVI